MTQFTRDDIEKAFIQAGSNNSEALAAGEFHSRFIDLSNATGEKEIKNLFFFLRDQVFQANFFYGESKEDRGNRILACSCFDLGIFDINYDKDESEEENEEVSATEMDVNKVLGVDLEALLYKQTVKNVMEITRGDEKKHANACGLNITTVTWEDTSRHKGSCWGNNISDMTLAVEVEDTVQDKTDYQELPVIRTSNFHDKSADIDPENFNIKIGNARDGELFDITLKEALEKPWKLLHDKKQWPLKDKKGNNIGLFADGVDKKVLVSAQACLMPITPKGGEATYKPHIYNYQSFNDEEHGPQPYVLTMMVTRHGTSVSICGKDKKFGRGTRGEPLWFNDKGEKAPLTSKRPNVTEKLEMEIHKAEGRTAQDNADQHNRVLIIQVPLIPKHTKRTRKPVPELYSPLFKSSGMKFASAKGTYKGTPISTLGMSNDSYYSAQSSDTLSTNPLTVNGVVVGEDGGGYALESYSAVGEVHDGAAVTDYFDQERARGIGGPLRRRRSRNAPTTRKISHTRTRGTMDIEDAVINTGETDGEFDESMGEGWKRDTSSPVRITVQLTKATSNGVITAEGMADLAQELQDVYQDASRISSLVVPE